MRRLPAEGGRGKPSGNPPPRRAWADARSSGQPRFLPSRATVARRPDRSREASNASQAAGQNANQPVPLQAAVRPKRGRVHGRAPRCRQPWDGRCVPCPSWSRVSSIRSVGRTRTVPPPAVRPANDPDPASTPRRPSASGCPAPARTPAWTWPSPRALPMDSLVTRDMEGRSITAGSAPGKREQRAGRQRRGDESAGRRMAIKQTDRRVPLHIGKHQALGKVRQELVEAEQLVALAHALAVAIDQHQDRLLAYLLDDVEHVAGKSRGLVDADRQRPSTPITAIESPVRRAALPGYQAVFTTTSWPSGNSEARISSSVMTRAPPVDRRGRQRLR